MGDFRACVAYKTQHCHPAAGFAECMTEEVDLPITIPLERWDVDYGTGASTEVIQSNMLRFAALADDIDAFDAGTFRMGPAEAAAMDPQQRVLLEQVYVALQVGISSLFHFIIPLAALAPLKCAASNSIKHRKCASVLSIAKIITVCLFHMSTHWKYSPDIADGGLHCWCRMGRRTCQAAGRHQQVSTWAACGRSTRCCWSTCGWRPQWPC